ncbi:hypothetical protein LTR47_012045, partial [Exophiala xenobiotica]
MKSQEEDGIPLPEYHHSIWTTWMISFVAIRRRSEAAADNRDLSYGLFDGMRARDILASPAFRSSLQEICRNQVAFNRAIRLLRNYCLVEEMADLAGDVLHPTVHRWS